MQSRVDILTPEFRADPYPRYAELRRRSPVCQVDPGGMWAVSRHRDVLFVLKNHERFSSQGFRAAWQPPWVGYNPLANSILALDGPAHTRLRGVVSRGLGPAALARIEPRVRELAAELARGLEGEIDFVAAFAAPLPAFVIGELLGLDRSLFGQFQRWADDLLSVTPEPQSPEHAARVRATLAEVDAYLTDVVRGRRRAPADDFVSSLVQAEAGGEPLPDRALVDQLVAVLVGGLETTTHFIASSALFLAENPAEAALLRESPALLPKFLEEMLRYDGPSQSVPRITTGDVDVGGVIVPAGSLVLALIGSANRDEQEYPAPDRFDLHRGKASLQFGHGVHFCVGAALARMEAKIALETLLPRLGRFERAAGDIPYNRTLTVRGPTALPLRFSS